MKGINIFSLIVNIAFVLVTLVYGIKLLQGNSLIIGKDTAPHLESSAIERDCTKFSQGFFLWDVFKDMYKGSSFEALFPQEEPETLFIKTKLFCAEFLSIQDAIDNGKNLNGTIKEINRIYQTVFPNFYTDYDEMEEIIGENDINQKQVWLGEISINIVEDINRVVG